ncbi:MAG: hypothetical protein EAZ51_02275 [Sphingobacteriales bacterium]|nr:MAG: hypothetical protein EAZ64_02120 [Sphingobacteriales bacterium]TAF82554.1 MAG: hypothetical protein EAZ51_02275 [Sphingobacteriales bacterium]
MQHIKTIADLRAHINTLEIKKNEHEIFLQPKINAIKSTLLFGLNTYHRIFGFFIGQTPFKLKGAKNIYQNDWVNLLSRFILPYILNKLFLKKSNFIVKALISLLSQAAITSVNKSSVANLVDKITQFVKSKTHKKQTDCDNIPPPNSETY